MDLKFDVSSIQAVTAKDILTPSQFEPLARALT